MKKVVLLFLFALFILLPSLKANPPDGSWFTSYTKAAETAKEKNLPIFVFFTGSDWCPVCKEFTAKVLQSQKFREYVKNRVVLLYIDRPRDLQLPDWLERQNQLLEAKYGIEGFPTVLLLAADGEVLDTLGYSPRADFVDMLNAALHPMAEKDYKPLAGWQVNYQQALKLAEEKKLPIIMVFNGSDWNPGLNKFQKDTLAGKEFEEFAAGKAILLYIDFPRGIRIPRSIVRQNIELLNQYKFKTLPMTYVLNPEGKVLGEVKDVLETNEYISQLKKILDRK